MLIQFELRLTEMSEADAASLVTLLCSAVLIVAWLVEVLLHTPLLGPHRDHREETQI